MKFAVGFQLSEGNEENFSNIVKSYKDNISEVFFSWQDIPSGRSGVASLHGYTDWNAQKRVEDELRTIKKLGIKLDLLFNGNCYGEYSLSEKLSNNVVSVIEHLENEVGGVDIVTTTSLMIAHTIKKHFPHIELRASVNMKIGTVKGMEYVSDLFDSFYVQREYNRDLEYIKELKLTLAKEALLYTDKTVGEIALELNYESTSSLNHNFKKATGFTPLEFRKMSTFS